jgi:hypothetical protein
MEERAAGIQPLGGQRPRRVRRPGRRNRPQSIDADAGQRSDHAAGARPRSYQLRYGRGMAFHEIGELMGLSESRVCQLHKRILSGLRTSWCENSRSPPDTYHGSGHFCR